MSYSDTADEKRMCEAKAAPDPTMADILREVSTAAADALDMTHRLSSFLLADTTEENERFQEPRCFKEELVKSRYDLFRLNNELGKLASSLGVM